MVKMPKRDLDGILVINKPKGPTSTQCLNKVARALNVKKSGHAGTLDPMASGVLLLLLGQATKLSSHLMGKKIYSGVAQLGVTTDTWDAEGETIAVSPVDNITTIDIKQAVEEWITLKEQEVPAYSAAKHEGQPLYSLSRKGLPTPVKIKSIQIFKAEVLEINLPYVKFRVECSSGTYIRSLAHSLGIRLGCGATLTELTREYSHPFALSEALPATEAVAHPEQALERLVPVAQALPDWPKTILTGEEEKALRNGCLIACALTKTGSAPIAEGQLFLLQSQAQAPLALAEVVLDQQQLAFKVIRGLWA